MKSLYDYITSQLDESVMDANLDLTDANVNPLVAPFSAAGKWGSCSFWSKGSPSADFQKDAFDRLWGAKDPKLLKSLGCQKQSAADSKRSHAQLRIMWYEDRVKPQLYINFGKYRIEWPNGTEPATGGAWANIMVVYDTHIMLNSGMTQPGTYGAGGKRLIWIVPDEIAEMMLNTLSLKYSTR